MKKLNVLKRVVLYYVLLLWPFMLVAQNGSLYKVSLSEQLQASALVIEGRILDQMALWDDAGQHIYTLHEIEVFKSFKGLLTSKVYVLTAGGLVGDQFEQVSDQPVLRKGDCGVLMLNTSTIQLPDGVTNNNSIFEVVSAAQGFYRYDFKANVAANVLSSHENIVDAFYPAIQSLTKLSYRIVAPFVVEAQVHAKGLKATAAVTISSISPAQASAGTQTVMVINGSGFGSETGQVGFKNANDGGATYFNVQASEIRSWSDTRIEVFIPSHAGTGNVRVTNAAAEVGESTEIITVTFAHTNLLFSDQAIMTQLIDVDGQGGYLWHMFTDFDENNNAKEAFTRAFNTWVCASKVNWRLGLPTSTDVTTQDGENVIRFDNGEELPLGVLGRCISYGFQCGDPLINAVVEMDMIVNDTENWNYGPDAPSSTEYDFETVVLHELGHGHQLGHVLESNDVMFYGLGEGSSKRQLSSNDLSGANYVQAKSKATPVCFFSVVTDGECLSNNIDEQTLLDGLKIYPNPASTVLHVENTAAVKLHHMTIIDVNGRKLATIPADNGEGPHSIDIRRLTRGIYFLNIVSDKASVSQRFVVSY
ncbi:T9SS type A sorting domain-containing protein [Carboxylicivirga mesophila]|uniref:T9SS type A sorting domain-containing protein n=1 Tax=Carboxylicivirga mesophila TaxID=1166478 RepID=A0ABS5KC79_9BACT|nr:T9SS type A sorting domain-containing protein [Carboxylicivirga mesophila]MBS2212640.1 T9SS type A sorting domain-containing protein [Carboxylicivirga mesophila]